MAQGFLDNLLCSIFGGDSCPNSLVGGRHGHSKGSPLEGVGGLVDTVTDVVGVGGKGGPSGLNGLVGNFADGLATGRKMGPVSDVANLSPRLPKSARATTAPLSSPRPELVSNGDVEMDSKSN